MSVRTKNRSWFFNRPIQLALLLALSAQSTALAASGNQFVRFTWEERSVKGKTEFRRVVLGDQGPVRIRVKQRKQDPVELDFDLKPHLKSNLVQNLFDLFTQSRSFQREGKRSRREALETRGKSTIRVDYGNENTVGSRLVAVSKNDPKLQSIHAFFKNLCEQELALLELKTALEQDRSRLLAKLKELDRNLRSSRVPAPDRLIPVLQRISQDPAVKKVARTLAFQIAQGIRSSMATVGESQGNQTKQAEQSQQQRKSPPGKMANRPSEDATIQNLVELVEMDVVVTDRKGDHVTDLRKEDFEVLQDGKPQKIQSLSYKWVQPPSPDLPVEDPPSHVSPDPAAASESRSSPELQRRLIAVVVDELGIGPKDMSQIRTGLKEFVDKQIQPNDLVALVRAGAGGDRISFTSDKALLLKALDRIKYNPSSRPGLNHDLLVAQDVLSGSSPFRQANLTLYTLDALFNTVAMMENLPFRKSVVLISGGLPLTYYSKIDRDIRGTMRRLTDACNRASVVIYSIEAERLRMLPQYNAGSESIFLRRGGSVRTPNDGRYHLARETGGVYFQTRNSPHIATNRILQDLQGYYLLAYTPDSPSPQTLNRRIDKIKVKVKKRGVRVRARSAAFGK